jgi:hypothetical protein
LEAIQHVRFILASSARKDGSRPAQVMESAKDYKKIKTYDGILLLGDSI